MSSSSEGSEDEEDPEHEQFERAQNHVMQPFAGNLHSLKLQGMSFFRHPVSRAIRITAEEAGNLTKCGRDINRVYINLGSKFEAEDSSPHVQAVFQQGHDEGLAGVNERTGLSFVHVCVCCPSVFFVLLKCHVNSLQFSLLKFCK